MIDTIGNPDFSLRMHYHLTPQELLDCPADQMPSCLVMCELGAGRSSRTADYLRRLGIDAVALTGGIAVLSNKNIFLDTNFNPIDEDTLNSIYYKIAQIPTVCVILTGGEYTTYQTTIHAIRSLVEAKHGNFLFEGDEKIAKYKLSEHLIS